MTKLIGTDTPSSEPVGSARRRVGERSWPAGIGLVGQG